MIRRALLSTLFLGSLFLFPARAQKPFAGANTRWVDSVFATLTLDEKIGQLLMPRGNTSNVPYEREKLLSWVRDYKVGGFVFFANQPTRTAQIINDLQAGSRVPLFVGMDLEWGLSMRLDSTARYPYAMTLGAIQGHNDWLLEMGRQVGRQCRRMGVHINYAPVADVNNNPNNPVINFRSFGENRQRVLEKSLAYMRGMQEAGLITTAKHFPGHGDTDVDSHGDLPVISHSRARLDSVELFPFRELIKNGLNGVMIAHLSIPALDATKNLPTTLSRKTATDLLRTELGFEGLVFTDAMEMQGVTKYFPNGEAQVRALLAGNDILETFTDVPGTVAAIKQAIASGRLPMTEIDAKVRRILTAKAWAGLDRYQPAVLKNLLKDLNPPAAELLNRNLTEAALTVVRNKNGVLPIRQLKGKRIATLSLGSGVETSFQKMAENYAPMEHFNLLPSSPDADRKRVKARLAEFDYVLVGIHGLGIRPAATLRADVQALVREFSQVPNAVYALFGNPYTLAKFSGLDSARALVVAYQETVHTQTLAAQLIFGAIGASGKLPVSVNAAFPYGTGLSTSSIDRMKYTIPEEVGIDSRVLTAKLDSIVNQGLSAKAYPGASVLVAKDGKVIFKKAYGYHTYENRQPVQESDLYDLASVTKISTAAPALMKLQDEGKFRLDMTLGELFPKWKKSNKANLKMRDILTHQSGLKAWIPFWRDAVDTTRASGWKPRTFATEYSKRYPVAVAHNLFLHRRYLRTILRQIEESPVNPKQGYVYSDLSYYLYPRIVEKLTGKPWEQFLKDEFYGPLGAGTLTYNAARVFPLTRIVPTEYDSLFRKELIHGRVHDEGATMLDGISGHAGLFGSANDLAKLMAMYLNGGTYGGQQYLQEATLKEWTRYQFPETSRRGVAFDKPDQKKPGLAAPPSASPASFGHSGFTGTFVWLDPQSKLLYVFLANRVYPTRNNSRISQLSTRTQFGEMIYEALRQGYQAVY